MASTDARPIPRKNAAFRVTFPILDADGDLVTGATALDSEVSGDGGTFADCTNEATEIATSSGMYYLDLTAAEMNYDTVAVIVKTTSTGAKTTPIVLYPEETGDIRVNVTQLSDDTTAADNAELFFDGTGYAGTNNVIPSVTTVTGNVNGSVGSVTGAVGSVTGAVGSVTGSVGSVTGNVGGNVVGSVGSVTGAVGSVAAGGITAASIATGAIDADALAADAVDEILDEQIGDSTVTMRQALKLMVAVLGAKASGGGTATITYRNAADTANVVVATVDANGNRTAVTLTL